MSGKPGQPQDDGMSRREFVQGRFWRALVRRRSATTGANDAAVPPPTALHADNHPLKTPLVMRYPKTLHQVKAGDASPHAAPLPPAAARRRTIPVLRPPGAVDEPAFLDGCTRCDECRQACPHDAIIHAPERLREAAGTPMIDADRQACLMCADFPCIAACEPGVLTSQIPPLMGAAKITEHLCLAYHGTPCTVCSEHCPVDSALNVSGGKPVVNESKCTGCGVCRYVCPAPENAILLMPTFQRPSPPRTKRP